MAVGRDPLGRARGVEGLDRAASRVHQEDDHDAQ